MASLAITTALFGLTVFLAKWLFLDSLILSPLRHIPGPKIFAVTKWRLAYEDWKGTRTRTINKLHQIYGPAVRIGPSEVSFNSLTVLRTIYGPGSGYGRTAFYRMFDVYGRQNLFTFYSPKQHGERKKLLAHAYSKSVMLKEPVTSMVEDKARQYICLIESEPENISEVFSTLHYYSLDNITEVIYGRYGSTSAMEGLESHRALISDILNPARRRLSWFAVHSPTLTQWLYTRTGLMGRLVKPLLPMQKPATYSSIREFALQAYRNFQLGSTNKETGNFYQQVKGKESFIVSRLWPYHLSKKTDGLDDLDIASECSDHFLAGIDTTSDTLMFLIWALSLPENQKVQEKLRQEVLNLPPESLNRKGFPMAETSDKCIYLNAVIKETLRLYAPLPATEPRSLPVRSVIDGYVIPGHTTVGMCPYTLHRKPEIFKDPLTFNPDRWLEPQAFDINKWFWAFSSGGRMCIGIHLAMVEMTTLIATVDRKPSLGATPALIMLPTNAQLSLETELPLSKRLELAFNAWKAAEGALSCWKALTPVEEEELHN
ncbi:hypothetical protein B7463_g9494, partial [Scytalidium lignicola]